MKTLAIVIPAYNEEKSVAAVVESVNNIRLPNVEITPVVINDCSTDNTQHIIASLKCVSLNLPCNLGIGGAVQTGYIYAWENGYDYAMQMDGDGQHPASEIPAFVAAMQTDNAPDVVIGSRYIHRQGFQSSKIRRLGIQYLGFIIRILTRYRITDCTSGFRMINRRALSVVCELYPDEYPEPEAILIFRNAGLKIREIPVTMQERIGGKSSIRDIASLYYIVKVSLAIVFTFFNKQIKIKHHG
ncbi:MAG: glycosyltransferase family 2 protein [Bacteroidales bacterium]|nr:glycosyltransferase family 2 protein [Bacteroidales bacterium]HOY39889.1 glycosyltransferase family 2 protein [Bacteroidales bacterium]HQP05155.1 glycosyltransferase family 2 protein [Bacteroidales bacterium]